MSILEIKNLSHVYDAKSLFDKANLAVSGGDHSGIVGLNGAGKSTFIKILSGEIVQDEGEVKWLNGITRGYLDQHADIDRSLTVMQYLLSTFSELYRLNEKMEAMYAEMADADEQRLDFLIEKTNKIMERLTDAEFFNLDAKVKKVAGGLGVAALGYDTPISNLSGGGRAKLMLKTSFGETGRNVTRRAYKLSRYRTRRMAYRVFKFRKIHVFGNIARYRIFGQGVQKYNQYRKRSNSQIFGQLFAIPCAKRTKCKAIRRSVRAAATRNRKNDRLYRKE